MNKYWQKLKCLLGSHDWFVFEDKIVPGILGCEQHEKRYGCKFCGFIDNQIHVSGTIVISCKRYL